jgi:hypothetical protein
MYQPYPTGGGQEPGRERPSAPQSVVNAVRLMYAGAAVSVIEIIVSLTSVGAVKKAIKTNYPHYTASQVHAVEVSAVAIALVFSLIGVGLWILMARVNAAGRNWARIVATVLFGINTLELLSVIARPHALLGLLFAVLLWLVGLGAIVLLWHRQSSAYFSAR